MWRMNQGLEGRPQPLKSNSLNEIWEREWHNGRSEKKHKEWFSPHRVVMDWPKTLTINSLACQIYDYLLPPSRYALTLLCSFGHSILRTREIHEWVLNSKQGVPMTICAHSIRPPQKRKDLTRDIPCKYISNHKAMFSTMLSKYYNPLWNENGIW